MMKTKFTLKSIFPLLVSMAMAYMIVGILPNLLSSDYYDDKLFPKIFLPAIMIFTFIVSFFIEVKTKFITVEIKRDEVIVKRFLGLHTKSYKLSEIDGWQYSDVSSRGTIYQYLYLYKKGKKIAKISQLYHRNYDEVKTDIKIKFKYLGYENFSYIDELKEIFK